MLTINEKIAEYKKRILNSIHRDGLHITEKIQRKTFFQMKINESIKEIILEIDDLHYDTNKPLKQEKKNDIIDGILETLQEEIPLRKAVFHETASNEQNTELANIIFQQLNGGKK